MGEPALQSEIISVAEYLAFEEKATTKHEYWNGCIRAMAGASPAHVGLAFQLSLCLGNKLSDKPCQVGLSDLAVRLDATNSYVYPDVLVWCENATFEDDNPRVLLSPTIVAEILSPSSTNYDRGAKLHGYLRIPSLTDYLILSPERVSTEHYSRADDGSWPFRHYVRREDHILLKSLGVELTVAEIYRKLNVPEGLKLVEFENTSTD